MMRTVRPAAVSCGFLLAAAVCAGESSGASLKFVVLGKTRPAAPAADSISASKAFRAMLVRAAAVKPDFLVLAGEQIYGSSEPDILELQWEAFEGAMKRWKRPRHLVPGWFSSPETEAAFWRGKGMPGYGSWRDGDGLFMTLDSSEGGKRGYLSADQLKWLGEVTGGTPEWNCGAVFIHLPLWSATDMSKESADAWWRDVHPLLVRARVSLVVSGGIGACREYPERDGIRYLNSGGGGAETDASLGGFSHMLVVEERQGKLVPSISSPDGRRMGEPITEKDSAVFEERLKSEPVMKIAEGGNAVFRVTVMNPLDRELQVDAVIDPDGSLWVPASGSGVIGGGKTGEVAVTSSVRGNPFPTPLLETVYSLDGNPVGHGSLQTEVLLAFKGLIDDFEDGDLINACGLSGISKVNGQWFLQSDDKNGSSGNLSVADAGEGGKALLVAGTLGKGPAARDGWMYLFADFRSDWGLVDLGDATGVRFRARAAGGGNVSVKMEGTFGGTWVTGDPAFSKVVAVGPDWKDYEIRWKEFAQPAGVCPGKLCVGGMTVDQMMIIGFQFLDRSRPIEFRLDDVSLMYE